MKQYFTKNVLLTVVLLCITLISSRAQAPYITVWKTDNTGTTGPSTIHIPAYGDYTYTWVEVGNPSNTGSGTGSDELDLTFPAAGTYELSMTPMSGGTTGTPFHRIRFSGADDRQKFLDIKQWGDVLWSSFDQAYSGTNVVLTATDVPNLSLKPPMTGAFAQTPNLVGAGLVNWGTAMNNITTMETMFFRSAFNQPIGNWDVSNVTNMSFTFGENTNFNQDISGWDVGKVTRMGSMFYLATSFNQNISAWNVGNVQDMSGMFNTASSFNQNIGGWNVSSVTNMGNMFTNATSFNQNIGGWNVSNVTDMTSMFEGAATFNQNLGSWNLSSLTDAISMLYYSALSCENFSYTLHGWANNPNTPQGIELLGVAPLVYGPQGQAAMNYLKNTLNWSVLSGDETYDPGCEITLSAVWGNISALFKNGFLTINWATLSETNNDHFEIEVSKDGKTFTKIAEIKSKALNGHSTSELIYTLEKGIPAGTAVLGICLLAISSISSILSRRKKLFFGLMIITGAIAFFAGCSKQDSNVMNNENEVLYVRIVQVDKDGAKSYSKVVKVVNN